MTQNITASLLKLKTILENSIADEKTIKIQQKEKHASCHFFPKSAKSQLVPLYFRITHPSARCAALYISALLQTKRQHDANI